MVYTAIRSITAIWQYGGRLGRFVRKSLTGGFSNAQIQFLACPPGREFSTQLFGKTPLRFSNGPVSRSHGESPKTIFNQPKKIKMIAMDKVNAYRSDEEGTGTIT
jgi:hypothetical protein